jgi:RNA polymerase sigma-54 factor
MVSSAMIKKKLQQLIENEDRDDPLSDETICQLLLNEGITVSRRTIAKYRGQLSIQPAFKRRREYRLKNICYNQEKCKGDRT